MIRILLVLAVVIVVVLAGLCLIGCSGSLPKNLGVRDGRLAPCPDSPNCVNSQSEGQDNHIEPLAFSGGSAEAIDKIAKVVKSMPGGTVVEKTDDYLHAEFASAVFGFVDDVEFYADPQTKLIDARSAARYGYYDFGVNRSRLERIRKLLASE